MAVYLLYSGIMTIVKAYLKKKTIILRMIKVRFPDGNELSYDDGITPFEIAEKISPSLARDILSVEYNDEIIETKTKLFIDGNIKFFKWNDKQGKKAFGIQLHTYLHR